MTTTVSGSSITFNDNTTQNTSAYGGGFAFRNRIINGDMRIDQRNAGASITASDGSFGVDRFKTAIAGSGVFTMQQSSTAPTGFSYSQLLTITTADTSIAASDEYSYRQFIEGYNTADLAWGTANAKTITLSFWVRSSVTGTYAVGLRNSAADRAYPATYTISSANTWEQKTITIAGDTSGTWLTTNGVGIGVIFSLGAGSNNQGTANSWNSGNLWSTSSATQWISNAGATFYITGVQLEKGSTATSFDYRPYGQELALCQRYYQQIGFANAIGDASTTSIRVICPLFVPLRAQPSVSANAALNINLPGTSNTAQSSANATYDDGNGSFGVSVNCGNFTGITAGKYYLLYQNTVTTRYIALSSEL